MPDVEDRTSQAYLTPGRLVVIARRRWWIVGACLLIAAAGALGYVKERPASWAATASVTVQPLPTVAGSSAVAGTLPGPAPGIEIQTPAVVAAAAAAAHLSTGAVSLAATASSAGTSITVTATAPAASQASAAAQAAAVALGQNRTAAVTALATGLDTQISGLGTQINQLAGQAKSNSFDAAKLAVVQTELQSLYTQQEDYTVAARAIKVATTAAPAHLTGTSKSKVLEIALLAGLLVGCGIALVTDRLDDRLRSASDLQEFGDLALLAELPTRRSARKTSFLAADAHDELSEAVRQLRTALRFLSVDKPMRTLLVTSAAPGEGKSFVAASLGVALAVSGSRTILVSSDLRRPGLEALLGTVRSTHGLSEAIADAALTAYSTKAAGNGADATNGNGADATAGATRGLRSRPGATATALDLADLLVETAVPNLWLVPAGASPPNPADLLGSTYMADLIEVLEAHADTVILDSPPVLAVTDALVLTAHADGVLLVMAKGRTSRAAGHRALRLLDSGLAPVLGVALNRSSRRDVIPYPYSDGAGRGTSRLWRHHRGPFAPAGGKREELGAYQARATP